MSAKLQLALRDRGVETFHTPGINDFPGGAIFEPPCSIKWIGMYGDFRIGAFSYAVSGFFSNVIIGRYCSIGEQVQVGRSNHVMSWASTSPFLHARGKLFKIGDEFEGAAAYHSYAAPARSFGGTRPKLTVIGNDVWIGHGAYIRPGVMIGDGAVIGAMSVVTKDVPSYAVVAGNPAMIRRLRLAPSVAARLMETGWWRFAPWQLTSVDFSVPEEVVAQIDDVARATEPYCPTPVQLRDLIEEE